MRRSARQPAGLRGKAARCGARCRQAGATAKLAQQPPPLLLQARSQCTTPASILTQPNPIHGPQAHPPRAHPPAAPPQTRALMPSQLRRLLHPPRRRSMLSAAPSRTAAPPQTGPRAPAREWSSEQVAQQTRGAGQDGADGSPGTCAVNATAMRKLQQDHSLWADRRLTAWKWAKGRCNSRATHDENNGCPGRNRCQCPPLQRRAAAVAVPLPAAAPAT